MDGAMRDTASAELIPKMGEASRNVIEEIISSHRLSIITRLEAMAVREQINFLASIPEATYQYIVRISGEIRQAQQPKKEKEGA